MNSKIIKKKNNNKLTEKIYFRKWFNEIIEKAKIIDIRYPIKGLYVWYPFGFSIRKNVYIILQKLMEDSGHLETMFPSLIPETEFMKEAEHIKGFQNEVYWVTHGGLNELDIKLVLRPTSETSIYPMFKLWIRSHNDLPLKIYQIVNTFRYETKSTKPLIRSREITSFKEAHTVHETFDQAYEQVKIAIDIYKRFFDMLCIPTLILKRPEWDKFPGGNFTIAFDVIMPDLKTLQVGTIHHLGNNFSKTYDIKYEDINGEQKYVHQTCYGISERSIAALISIHGDNNGLVLPSLIAPIQVVIIPILYDSNSNDIINKCLVIEKELNKNNIKTFVDLADQRPGYKYNKWELNGVCIRVEIGPKDIINNTVTIVDRLFKVKEIIDSSYILNVIHSKLELINKKLLELSTQKQLKYIHFCDTKELIIKYKEKGVLKVYLCNNENCRHELETISYMEILGEDINKDIHDNKCIICGNEKSNLFYLSKKY